MPCRYRHIRTGQRQVRKEYYILAEKLKAELHMSEKQVHGSIIAVANVLFGRKEFGEWKAYNRDLPTENNTLPSPSNLNRTEPYMEAMILAGIVTEIMSPDSKEVVITYSNDGSGQSGVGNYVVQSFAVNGKQRALPTLPVFTESKETLKELEILTLEILSAASGGQYSERDILERIDFVMTDSTAHNLGVMEEVGNEVGSESIPESLVCNVHPTMMFQRKVKDVFQEIHDTIGTNAIKDCFLVDVDFRNESFIFKAIHCLIALISSDYSSKPWNRQSHFDSFIQPKKNESISLKDHRFNRLFDCCLSVLYHFEDIKSYLDTFSNIINGIAILDRSFLDMELLQPIFCAVSLIGVHFARPYLSLLLDTETTFDTLREAFPIFYSDLKETECILFMQTKEQVCTFVSPKKFRTSLPKDCLLEILGFYTDQYQKEVEQMIGIFMSRMAEGFAIQRGGYFWIWTVC